MPKYEAACGRCYAEYELDEKPDNAIFCPNCHKHGGPLVGVLNFEECVDDIVTERDTLLAQLTASQQSALDYHRRWQEAEAKMVSMEEARNAAMKAEGEAKAQLKASQDVVAAFMKGVLDLQANVKLLRETLKAMTGQATLFNRDSDPVWVAVKKMAIDAFAATEPKGE